MISNYKTNLWFHFSLNLALTYQLMSIEDKFIKDQLLYFDSIVPLESFDPIIEDIKDSHIRRGHEVTKITTHEEQINHYICSCGASINREINNL